MPLMQQLAVQAGLAAIEFSLKNIVASLQTAPEQGPRAGASMPLMQQLAVQAGLAADEPIASLHCSKALY